jgi:hypothetical protein
VHQAHAFAAAARGSLQHHRITDPRQPLLRACSNDSKPRDVPGTNGTPAFSMACRARVFDPIAFHRRRGGPDEFHARINACLRELRVLGEKSVAGMDGIGARARATSRILGMLR